MTAAGICCIGRCVHAGVPNRATSWWTRTDEEATGIWGPLCGPCGDLAKKIADVVGVTGLRSIPITEDRACQTHDCIQPVEQEIVWPGDGPVRYCRRCGDAAWRILEVLGSRTFRRDLPLPEPVVTRTILLETA